MSDEKMMKENHKKLEEVAKTKAYYRSFLPMSKMFPYELCVNGKSDSLSFLDLAPRYAKVYSSVFRIDESFLPKLEAAIRESFKGAGRNEQALLKLNSSALCFLLHFYRLNGLRMEIDGGIFEGKKVAFEDQHPVFNSPANLDGRIDGTYTKAGETVEASLFLEGKFCEFYEAGEFKARKGIYEKDFGKPYLDFFRKYLAGIPDIAIEGGQRAWLTANRPAYLEGLKQMIAHFIGISNDGNIKAKRKFLALVDYPFEECDVRTNFEKDLEILAKSLNRDGKKNDLYVLPKALHYGKDIVCPDMGARFFYSEFDTMPKVGPFFYIDEKIHAAKSVMRPIKGDEFVDSDISHFDFYEKLRKDGVKGATEHTDYGYFPRGRVLFDVKNLIYKVYVDQCLLKSVEAKERIAKEYCLKDARFEFDVDEHYRCAGCDETIRENDRYI